MRDIYFFYDACDDFIVVKHGCLVIAETQYISGDILIGIVVKNC